MLIIMYLFKKKKCVPIRIITMIKYLINSLFCINNIQIHIWKWLKMEKITIFLVLSSLIEHNWLNFWLIFATLSHYKYQELLLINWNKNIWLKIPKIHSFFTSSHSSWWTNFPGALHHPAASTQIVNPCSLSWHNCHHSYMLAC